jgi:LacI family transcriptional regulator
MLQVAARAGVSVKTVSRVINNERWVSEGTTARVLKVIEELGYQADVQAGNLRRKDGLTRSIGLLVGGVDNPFHGTLARAIEDVATPRGVTVLINSLDQDEKRERQIVAAYLRRRVDALLLTTASKDQKYLSLEQRHGTPVAFIDSIPVGIKADAVMSNSRVGAFNGTRHLIEHGHRRIAYLGIKDVVTTVRERKRGFLDAVRQAGIPERDAPIRTDLLDSEQTFAAVLGLLDSDEPPTAIFSSHFGTTVGAIRALQRRSLQRSIALVGFDDLPLADLLDPGVTVIAQNPASIGRLAAQLVFARLDGVAAEPRTYTIPTTLIPRGSGEIPPRI